jgi:hypothetical protein
VLQTSDHRIIEQLALRDILARCVEQGLDLPATMAQVFHFAIFSLNVATSAIRNFSPNLSEDDRAWVCPWVEEAGRLARVAELHASMFESKSPLVKAPMAPVLAGEQIQTVRFQELLASTKTILCRTPEGQRLPDDDIRAVLDCLVAATEIQPTSPRPFVIAASMFLTQSVVTAGDSPVDNLQLARVNAERSLERDPGNTEARYILTQATSAIKARGASTN